MKRVLFRIGAFGSGEFLVDPKVSPTRWGSYGEALNLSIKDAMYYNVAYPGTEIRTYPNFHS